MKNQLIRFIKIFIIILLTIITLFVTANATIFFSLKDKHNKSFLSTFERKNFSVENFMKNFEENNFNIEENNKKGLLLFGCLYTKGDKETDGGKNFGYYLSKETKRPTYNRAFGGGGIQHAILQVQSGKLNTQIGNSEYAIYTLSALCDIHRLYRYSGPWNDPLWLLNSELWPQYEERKDKQLVLKKSLFPLIEGSPIYRFIQKKINNKKETNSDISEKDIDFAMQHFLFLNKELKSINPNIKLVIISYWSAEDNFSVKNLVLLEEHDIQFISFDEETREKLKKYKDEKTYHPTAQAWEFIVPIILNELKN